MTNRKLFFNSTPTGVCITCQVSGAAIGKLVTTQDGDSFKWRIRWHDQAKKEVKELYNSLEAAQYRALAEHIEFGS